MIDIVIMMDASNRPVVDGAVGWIPVLTLLILRVY